MITREYAKECVGAGWHSLIDRLYDCKPEDTIVTQVKEKFGGLRFYVSGTTDEFMDEIESAEMRSERMCEVCGNGADIKNIHGWYKCLCDEHSGVV